MFFGLEIKMESKRPIISEDSSNRITRDLASTVTRAAETTQTPREESGSTDIPFKSKEVEIYDRSHEGGGFVFVPYSRPSPS